MKKINPVYYVITIVLLIAVVIWQYNNTSKLTSRQGALTHNNIIHLQFQLKNDLKELSAASMPEKEEIDSIAIRLDEDATILTGSGVTLMPDYLSIIKLNLLKISDNIKNNKSQEDSSDNKKTAVNLINVLIKEMDYIEKNCGNDGIKYYNLENTNNSITKKVNDEMLDYLNKNNIH